MIVLVALGSLLAGFLLFGWLWKLRLTLGLLKAIRAFDRHQGLPTVYWHPREIWCAWWVAWEGYYFYQTEAGHYVFPIGLFDRGHLILDPAAAATQQLPVIR